jgi:hypothetical protein
MVLCTSYSSRLKQFWFVFIKEGGVLDEPEEAVEQCRRE